MSLKHISKIKAFLILQQNNSVRQQKLRYTRCNGKLHESVILGIHMFVKMWNLFPEKLKTTK